MNMQDMKKIMEPIIKDLRTYFERKDFNEFMEDHMALGFHTPFSDDLFDMSESEKE